jgi:flagellar biosynthesis/type III secretory pathway protein FliH
MYEKYFKPFTDLEYHYEIKNCLETAYEEGYAKGLAQGQREAVLMMAARKLKERGESVADIAELTGLAADEIAAL